jgi:hypothetical protein
MELQSFDILGGGDNCISDKRVNNCMHYGSLIAAHVGQSYSHQSLHFAESRKDHFTSVHRLPRFALQRQLKLLARNVSRAAGHSRT